MNFSLSLKKRIMKNLFLAAMVICFGFLACGTPSPSTAIPSDSIMDSGQPAPDSVRVDTTRS
jgi:hypothetical protein